MKKNKLNFQEFKDNSKKSQVIADMSDVVDNFLKLKDKIDKLQQEQEQLEAQLIQRARQEYENNARMQEFCKTYNVTGNKYKGLQITFSDKFKSLPLELQKTLIKSNKQLAKYFDTKRDIKLSKTDPETVSELLNILGADKFNKYFTVKVYTVTKSGFDKVQFTLPDEIRNVVQQYKPSVKKMA